MQPLTLKAFIRATNKIVDVEGYQIVPYRIIRIYQSGFVETFNQDDILILRNSGFKDSTGQELFEDDLVTVMAVDFNQNDDSFIGRIKFRNNAFVIEGRYEVVTDCVPSQLKHIGNFNLNPLVFETLTQ